MPQHVKLEVVIESPIDAINAERGGADRLLLCSGLDLGGLTPSLGLYEAVRAATQLPVHVMIRPRPGDFVYSDFEYGVMLRDVGHFRIREPEGFVFAGIRDDGTIDAAKLADLVKAAGGLCCGFHRALDRVPDAREAIDALVNLGFDRCLTSGRKDDAVAGMETIREWMKHAARRIDLVPCGKITAFSAPTIVDYLKCDQLHGSFGESVPETGGRGTRGYARRTATSRTQIEAVRRALQGFSW